MELVPFDDSSDLTEYSMVGKQQFPTLSEKFGILKDIARIHQVAPENLAVLFVDTELSKLDRAEVIALIRTRADYKSSWNGKLF